MKHLFATIMLLYGYFCLWAQKDTVELGSISIYAARTPNKYANTARLVKVIGKEEIAATTAQSLPELLEGALNMDIRQRGADEVQSDINMAGGSFEQVAILLNGIKLNDPQSGHHHLNLPIAPEDIERIEIFSGTTGRVHGANAFSGAINIITTKVDKNFFKARLSGGQYHFLNGGFSAGFNYDNYSSFVSLSSKNSDGYTKNTDFNITNLYYSLKNKQDFGSFTLQMGYKDKSFGAQSFYTPKYPNQFEQTKTTFAALNFESNTLVKLNSHVFWRRNQDRFELFRTSPPSWYKHHNYHLTDVYGADINASYEYKKWASAIGLEYRSENILSNVLGNQLTDTMAAPGEPLGFFTKSAYRNSLQTFVESKIKMNRFDLNGGLFSIFYSDFDWKLMGGIDLIYHISNGVSAYANYNQSIRLPSFTDLYYQGPTNVGNKYLKPEKAEHYEVGLKWLHQSIDLQSNVFYRKGTNIIDWVRITNQDLWQSANITTLNTYGAAIQLKIHLNSIFDDNFLIQNFTINYAYTNIEKSSGTFESYYSLDFLRHNASLASELKITKKLSWQWQMLFQDRNGLYDYFDEIQNKFTDLRPYESFFIINSKLRYQHNALSFFISADNLLNKTYFDLGNIEMPGRWLKAGVSIHIDYL